MKTKQFVISKQLVMQTYRLVKANAGAAGVDHQTLDDFEEDLKSNLYRLWVLASLTVGGRNVSFCKTSTCAMIRHAAQATSAILGVTYCTVTS